MHICATCGRRGIRTHGGREPSPVFKTGALNRSASLPFPEFTRLPVVAPAQGGRAIGCTAGLERGGHELEPSRRRPRPSRLLWVSSLSSSTSTKTLMGSPSALTHALS